VLIGFLLALAALGLDLQKITILAGALGVGIGFGLQTIVNNFVCGLILLFERPIKVGDLIQLDSEWAYIKKIGLRATIVETFDQAEVVVPNSDLIANKVTNWTLSSRLSRLTIPVGVAYGSDVPLVLQILKDCAEQHPLVTKIRPPQVLFMDFGESSLDFELRVFVEDVANRLQVMSELHQAIDRRFREAGVEIPFPQRDIHIRSPKPSASASVDALLEAKDSGTTAEKR
jgi:potassium efflux system protein